MMKVLHAAAEAAPFIKTGGLGEVIGALPKELIRQGVDVRVVLPRYRGIEAEYLDQMVVTHRMIVPVGWRQQVCDVSQLTVAGVTFYFIGNDYYFDRSEVYGHHDDHERFAFFCRAVLEALPQLEFQPDILHCHDWHTGMMSVLLDAHYRTVPFYAELKTVFTIHNLEYQGNFSSDILGDMLDLGWEYFTPDGVEASGQVSFLKGGLNCSDAITTVSKSYAEEILQPEYGQNMDGLLRKRSHQLTGIVNGLDYAEYDPRNGIFIATPFDARSLRKRRDNKLRLQESLGLPAAEAIPVVGIVSRLVESKGMDLIADILDELLQLDSQLIVLGTGEERYESFFAEAAQRYPQQVAVAIRFDDGLARRIYAGSDMFLMPSRVEPCGLSQLTAMRYGSIPVVHATGGLKDTVVPYDEQGGGGTGFCFSDYCAPALLDVLQQAYALYHDKKAWNKLVQSAMKSNFSWQQSSDQYKSLYGQLLAK
ncbi:glycogen synthase GlgA [bacterium BFN5]|nr:glycogen synthase GlgA [bacterium BFN5]QJW45221.1 glycogen synthase GlgA [bacterium BFN5]